MQRFKRIVFIFKVNTIMSEPQFIIDADGKRTGVILTMEDYEELMEDLHDMTVIAERKGDSSQPADEVFTEIDRELRNVQR